MSPRLHSLATACLLYLLMAPCLAEIKVVVDKNAGKDETPRFKFKTVPSPCLTERNVALAAKFRVIDGKPNPDSSVDALHDGLLPTNRDQPTANFFFLAGSDGGRVLVDLGKCIDIEQIDTYSWHKDTRGPQVYKVYGSDGTAKNFKPDPGHGTNPADKGWTLIASVDTRDKEDAPNENGIHPDDLNNDAPANTPGGQYGVSITNTRGSIGKYRYLLFDMSPTESFDPFGNTFYSEIAIIDGNDLLVDARPAKIPRHSVCAANFQCLGTADQTNRR